MLHRERERSNSNIDINSTTDKTLCNSAESEGGDDKGNFISLEREGGGKSIINSQIEAYQAQGNIFSTKENRSKIGIDKSNHGHAGGAQVFDDDHSTKARSTSSSTTISTITNIDSYSKSINNGFGSPKVPKQLQPPRRVSSHATTLRTSEHSRIY
jgi:hypothetical protein